MQERKRLEEAIADDQRIASLTSDLDTLFELAREGEDVDGDIARELKTFSEVTREGSRPPCCFRAKTTPAAPS